ncbi:hypothetical protein [Kribbella sp. NPDC048915]|uniref:hypothetical protein n=1 Tax=Kribbella sp. NPDC048915 TaxID=3155148 RepID=UPI00340636F9
MTNTDVVSAPPRGGIRRRLPALGLFFLAPLVAEFLLGNIPISALYALVALAPMYGGGAVLIRELVRRRGWGYPSVVILALAYGVLEEGIATKSLFDPNYAGLRLLDPGHIGFLGMGAPWTVFVLGLHTVWSITVPIVLTESASRRPREPWLGRVGLAVYGVLFVLGVIATSAFGNDGNSFQASIGQYVGVVVAIALLVFLAWVPAGAARGNRSRNARGNPGGKLAGKLAGKLGGGKLAGNVPAPWLTGISALVLGSAWMAVDELVHNGWAQAALLLAVDALAAFVLLTWSRRPGWSQGHALAAAGGALLTYAWHAFPETPVIDTSRTVDLVGNVVFALLAVVLLSFATIRRAKFGDT